MASIHFGGVTHPIKSISVRDAKGVLQSVRVGRIRDAAKVLRRWFGSLAVTLTEETVLGRLNSSLSVNVQTKAVQAVPSGGAGPYSYLWAQTGGTGTWTIAAPTEAVTTFTGGTVGPGEDLDATFRCTVTDSVGNVVVSVNVAAHIINIGWNVTGGGGPLP